MIFNVPKMVTIRPKGFNWYLKNSHEIEIRDTDSWESKANLRLAPEDEKALHEILERTIANFIRAENKPDNQTVLVKLGE